MRQVAAALAAVGLALVPRVASAQCAPRPTDAAGYAGYAYAQADDVRSYATNDIRVHYASKGDHVPTLTTARGDGVPDTVAYAAAIGDEALRRFAEMGFAKPPSDAACASNGGDEKVDVYLVRFARGADGTTVPIQCTGTKCASFLLVDSAFLGRGYATPQEGFRTVVTHELFHAVQNAYDRDLDRFWAEGTAQWAMKVLHPELADFERQLPAYFAAPTRSLDSAASGVTAGFLYGSAVWPLFLATRHGQDVVRDALEIEGSGQKTVDAIDAALREKGSSLADEFPLFAAWNVGTKTRAGVGGYPDAAKYPGIADVRVLEDGASAITSGLAYFAYEGDLAGRTNVSLETDAARNGGVLVPLEGASVRLDRAAKLPTVAEGRVLVVVAGITPKKTDAPFAVRLSPVSDGPVTSSGGSDGSQGDNGGCGCSSARASHTPATRSIASFAALVALFWHRRAKVRSRDRSRLAPRVVRALS